MDKNIYIQRFKNWVIFGLLYLLAFAIIEKITTDFYIIHTPLDDIIPFCEYFIWPYIFWFPYVGLTVLYMLLKSESEKEHSAFFMNIIIGSIIFIAVSVLMPNAQNMRPIIASDSISKTLVNFIWSVDTPTNILPSLHVYNSVACFLALVNNRQFAKNKKAVLFVAALSISIILSTMFLKQHSIVDVVAALMCNYMVYDFIYKSEYSLKAWKKRSLRYIKNKKHP